MKNWEFLSPFLNPIAFFSLHRFLSLVILKEPISHPFINSQIQP